MADYLRKPAPGTPARQAYDAKQRLLRRPCECGSRRLKTPGTNHCVACNPANKAFWDSTLQLQKGSKQ